jgi:SAM-dependent MidA family methyltransferase
LSSLHDILVERIVRSGPVPFAAFMSQALYEPGLGYYSTAAGRTDWNGHYVTSPEIDPAYGELWGRAFEEIWRSSGTPARFDIVEVGPGEAGFAASVLASASGDFARALRYQLVERSIDAKARQEERLGNDERVSWVASASEIAPVGTGAVYMNEVVDNLPVHLVERRGRELVELYVSVNDGRLEFVDGPSSSDAVTRYFERLALDVPDGHRFEVGLAAESLAARAADAIGKGVVVIVDYGAEAEDLASRPAGSLACYFAGGVDDQPLERAGEKDITVHANWTSLRAALERAGAEVAGPLVQKDVLRTLGIGELDSALRDGFAAATAAGRGAEGLRALSRRQALGVLVDPGGLGSLGVMIGAKGTDLPNLSP